MDMKYTMDRKVGMTMRMELYAHEKTENQWVMKERYNSNGKHGLV